MLNILIPQYNEDESVIGKLLDSLALQQGISFDCFSVFICNDGGGVKLSKKFFEKYPFDVTYIRKAKNGGPASARNMLLEAADGEYIMFCDADDMFIDLFALNKIFSAMPFDALISCFVEEAIDFETGMNFLTLHEQDRGFVHGKVYRLEHIRKLGIHFNESLDVNEDIPFNNVAIDAAENVKYCEKPLYLWKWNPNSITRSSKEWHIEHIHYAVRSSRVTVYTLLQLHMEDKAAYYVAWMAYFVYYALNGEVYGTESAKTLEEEFAKYWHKYKHLFPVYTRHTELMQTARAYAMERGFEKEHFTFDDWISKFS